MRKETPPEGFVRVYVHTRDLSYNNGAVGPLGIFIDLTKLFEVDPEWGTYYYDDSIVVSQEDLPVLIQLLTEQRMIYKMDGLGEDWKGFVPPVQPVPVSLVV